MILVLADVRPHGPGSCPHGINVVDEIAASVSAGSRILVAIDWLNGDPWWRQFDELDGFVAAPLVELVEVLDAGTA